MKFAEALPLLEGGQRVTVPLMEGCTAVIGDASNGERALVLLSANGKRIAPWSPSLAQMLSDEWGVAPAA